MTRTPSEPAITTACASPTNRPCSTTPAIPSSRSASDLGSAIRPSAASRIQCPPSGGNPRRERPSCGAQSERHHLDRKREPAQRRHPFRFIHDDDHAGRGRGDDLLSQQRAPTALDQAEIRRDLVGAVDGEIELRRLVEVGERHAQPLGVAASRFGCGHADHVEAGADTFGQEFDEVLSCRAAAKAKSHAGTHELERAGGGCTFLAFDIHCDRDGPLADQEQRWVYLVRRICSFYHASRGLAFVNFTSKDRTRIMNLLGSPYSQFASEVAARVCELRIRDTSAVQPGSIVYLPWNRSGPCLAIPSLSG